MNFIPVIHRTNRLQNLKLNEIRRLKSGVEWMNYRIVDYNGDDLYDLVCFFL